MEKKLEKKQDKTFPIVIYLRHISSYFYKATTNVKERNNHKTS